MAKKTKPEPTILVALEALYEQTRKKVIPLYPYDSKTNTIHLPPGVDEELKMLLRTGNKVEAVKRVAQLTGAQLAARLGGRWLAGSCRSITAQAFLPVIVMVNHNLNMSFRAVTPKPCLFV